MNAFAFNEVDAGKLLLARSQLGSFDYLFDSLLELNSNQRKLWGIKMGMDWPTTAIVVTIIVSLVSMVMKYVPAKTIKIDENQHSLRNVLQATVTEVAVLKTQFASIVGSQAEIKTEVQGMRNEMHSLAQYVKQGNK